MSADLFTVLALVALRLLRLVVVDVAARDRLTYRRSSASCVVARERPGGAPTYRMAVSPETRARRGAPRDFLEFVAAGDRTFVVEYQGTDARDRARAAAGRLDAFLAGEGAPLLEEAVGSPVVTWGLVGSVLVRLAGVGSAYGLVGARLDQRAELPSPTGQRF